MPQDTAPTTSISSGRLRGRWEGGVAAFRSVPYAAPPVGRLRFQPPMPAPSWEGERAADKDGPVPPQPPARLDRAMGSPKMVQGEDCLTLTIHTPRPDNARRPVLLWIHGGAFLSGAGSLAWYSGAAMAARGDMVVVSVNYRLGVLGFFHMPGFNEPNLGLRDQFAALEWVRRNIAHFGGDPANVTVAGQSAGGYSAVAMLGSPAARACFRRAIVQSAPFSLPPKPVAEAAATGQRLLAALGKDVEALRTAEPAEIIAAQVKVMMAEARFASATPPFIPVADGVLLGESLLPAAWAGAMEKDVMVGYTRDEFAAFFAIDERATKAEMATVDARFRDFFGAAAVDARQDYARRHPHATPGDLLQTLMTDHMFAAGTHAFADRLATLGRAAFMYRFDWAAPGNAFGACHCIELPFVFNNLDQWAAPMLAGGDAIALAEQVQDAWIAFARHGDPNHGGLAAWPRYDAAQRMVMCFNTRSEAASDPADYAVRRFWPS